MRLFGADHRRRTEMSRVNRFRSDVVVMVVVLLLLGRRSRDSSWRATARRPVENWPPPLYCVVFPQVMIFGCGRRAEWDFAGTRHLGDVTVCLCRNTPRRSRSFSNARSQKN